MAGGPKENHVEADANGKAASESRCAPPRLQVVMEMLIKTRLLLYIYVMRIRQFGRN